MATSGYRLPCVYCVEGTSFPSSEALKKHLVSSHESLISRSKSLASRHVKSSSGISLPDASVKLKSDTFLPQSSADSAFIDKSYSSGVFGSEQKSRASMDNTVPAISSMKMKLLLDRIQRKDETIENLLNENERLKTESRTKDEEQNRVRQKWKAQAEDMLRILKTEQRELVAQNQLLERQLRDSQEEKNKLRDENDKITKEHANLQLIVTKNKRINEQHADRVSIRKESDFTVRELSFQVETLKSEKASLQAVLSSKENAIKMLQTKQEELVADLRIERNKNSDLNRERVSLKGQLALLEATYIQSESDVEMQKESVTNLSSKLNRLEINKSDLDKQVWSYTQTIKSLQNDVECLKTEKRKMIEKLEKTDSVLSKLSVRVSSPPQGKHAPRTINGTGSSYKHEESKQSFEQLLHAVKQLASKNEHSSHEEVTRLTSQLQDVNMKLVDEKSNALELKRRVVELESYLEQTGDVEELVKKQFTDLQLLRSKHQICLRKDKIRKQLKADKRRLKRKYDNVVKEVQLLTVLYNSAKEELSHKDQVLNDLNAERKNYQDSHQHAREDLNELQKEILQKEVAVEKYKRESCYLLEKLNTSTEEVSTLKDKNESLEIKLEDFNDLKLVKDGMRELIDTLSQIRNETKGSAENNTAGVESLVKRNIELTNEIATSHRKIYNGERLVESLKQNIEELENVKATNEAEIERLLCELDRFKENAPRSPTEYDSIIENLILEKEILSSRVLILEGIREEMEFLREEKEKLREENEEQKRKMAEFLQNASRFTVPDIGNEETVLIQKYDSDASEGDFLESVKTLDHLDEEDKVRLKEILSMPDFQDFLSRSSMVIDPNDSDDATDTPKPDNLNSDCFEEVEHVVNYITGTDAEQDLAEADSAEPDSAERVQKNYTKSAEDRKRCAAVDNTVEQKSLDKIFTESKIIRDDVALQNQTKLNADTSKILQEFNRVLKASSTDSSPRSGHGNSPSKTKQVQFSNHVVKFLQPENKRGGNVGQPFDDTSFYRSYFQEALGITYPMLTRLDDEDIERDLDDASCSSNASLGQSPTQGENCSEEQTNSANSAIFNTSSTLLNSKPTHDASQDIFISPNASKTKRSGILSPLLGTRTSMELFKSLSEPSAFTVQQPQRFCSDNTFDRRNKRVGVLPLICELENEENTAMVNTFTHREKAADALNILRSFISKADEATQGNAARAFEAQDATCDDDVADQTSERTMSSDHLKNSSSLGISVDDDNLFQDGDINVTDNAFPIEKSHLQRAENDQFKASTPSVPMHRPVSFDFSDGSLNNLDLFYQKVEDT
ncbi:early endosome antigen 1-like [Hydractinia symbiolongicarpus]|uniref:early endosome antigen 1-like n=1 Tax=Hydractinia symbiolongicarpus TaxID=13093 RepID=UPI00254F6427|nr:early endosome antigen 1-like [Hydractinia symbiolongicarpus]